MQHPHLVDRGRQNAGGAPVAGENVEFDPQRLLAAIVESSDDAILAKDLDGVITSWNTGAQRLYGYSAEEAVGQPVAMLVPEELENDLPRIMERLRRGERIQHYETTRLARDGRRLAVSLTISPIRDGTGRTIGASTIARDITFRKTEESRWRLLSSIGERLTPVLEADELLRELARTVVGELADYCITYLLEGTAIRRVGAAHADPTKVALVQRLVELAPPALTDQMGAGAVIRTGEAVLAPEVPIEMLRGLPGGDEYREVVLALAPVSSIILPLQARGRTIGAIAIASTTRSRRRYAEEDLAFGRMLSERAALSLDNVRLYAGARAALERSETAEAELRQRYEQLRVLYEMTEPLGRAGELEQIYDRALDGLGQALHVERAAILLFDSRGEMRFEAWRGLSEEYRSAVDGHSPWSPGETNPLPVTIPDAASEPGLDADLRGHILREGVRALAFIPLIVRGQLLGKFMLYSDVPRIFQADELELARTIAGTVAFAIVRARDERSVREARDEAERANEAKSQFLGIMSHELRTPLNAVLGYTELLLLETKGPLTADQREQLERVQASAAHQLGLVEELLGYTRLEAGREEPRLMPTDVRRVVLDVAELVRPEADRKGLRLTVELVEPLPNVLTDPAKLRQIALNLAANATKYTDEGEVLIRASQSEDILQIDVKDTGPGIPGDKLDYVFEPFTRVDESRTRLTSGTGLGLAIVRGLTELLGGEVKVQSGPARGSLFTLRLPAPAVTGDADATAGPPTG